MVTVMGYFHPEHFRCMDHIDHGGSVEFLAVDGYLGHFCRLARMSRESGPRIHERIVARPRAGPAHQEAARTGWASRSRKGQRPCLTCSMNSSLYLGTKLLTGIERLSASTQIVLPSMLIAMLIRRSRSAILPRPASRSTSSFSIHPVPSRQGVHWPHDS